MPGDQSDLEATITNVVCKVLAQREQTKEQARHKTSTRIVLQR